MTLKPYIIVAGLLITALAVTGQSYNNIEFIENKGQWDPRVKFKGDVSAGAFFIRSNGFTVLQHNQQDLQFIQDMMHGHSGEGKPVSRNQSTKLRSHAYQVDFIGASPDMEVIPDKALSTYNNYFIGNDPSKWAGGCRIYQAITLKNVYKNVDVRYYTDNGTLKYDIIAKPGADISKIALKYNGVDKLQVKNKELLISTSVGDLKESSPYTYQANGKQTKEVGCKYEIKNNEVRFNVSGYDPNSTLIIDPSLIFCSFAGSPANEWGFSATYGPDGSAYGGGIVFENGFPVLAGAFQTNFQGGNSTEPSGSPVDIGIIKLSPNGSNRIYATYIGGGGNELPSSLIVDNAGNLVLAGRTNSANYPTVPSGSGGLIGTGGDWDIIVTKLNATGTALIGSKRIGGTSMDGGNITAGSNGVNSLNRNYGDEARSEVILDGAGNIYVASCTQSIGGNVASDRFPVTAGAFQPNAGGGSQDGVLLKFNSNVSSLLFASFIGGSSNDAAYVLSLAPSGNIFVAGGTESGDFLSSTHAGTLGAANNGGIDGFVAEISNNGSSVIRSTYVGTSGSDQVFGIQFDRKGFPYIMGQTTGAWPVINAPYNNAGAKQFIAKLKPDLSAFVYSTVFGTASVLPNISPVAFLVDRCENVYVSGWGGNIYAQDPNFYPSAGTLGMPVTPDAIKSNTDNTDFYFFVLKRDAVSQLYGSFFGKDGGFADHVDGGTSRFDQNGVIYEAICADCGNGSTTYPTTPGAWSTQKPAGAFCNLAMVKVAFNLAGVASNVQASINGVPRDTAGCIPLTVDFSDSLRIAVSYEWNFGDGSPVVATTNPTISHTYNAVGTYQVMLIAIDPNTCNIRDTSYTHIRVGDIRALIDFNPTKLNPCDSFKYRFDNLSFAPPVRPFGAQSFIWDFGDGTPRTTAGSAPVTHNYTAPGTYDVKLILPDTNYCNAPDSLTIQLRVAANVKAQFTTPPTGCVPYDAVFTNNSLAGQSFQWDFGDGTTSTATNPTHLYNTAGTYTIVLVANDPNTCNLTDTTRVTIKVFDNPIADFSYAPNPPIENTATVFTNLSSPDATSFRWDFGDGDTLKTNSRLPVQHQYNATGTFNACLTVYNSAGCSDTTCKQVQTLISPLVDVPNAFTPQSGDVNSVIMVRGFGIAKMQFIIWNRWGQKVFETANRQQGWDGRVKGKVQPMDVYAYTLSVEFFDGTKTTRKGDITLIR
ncbi:MAG: PKD domain-containing protein [Bacteroidota bacterium]